jgi:hypothetical protein
LTSRVGTWGADRAPLLRRHPLTFAGALTAYPLMSLTVRLRHQRPPELAQDAAARRPRVERPKPVPTTASGRGGGPGNEARGAGDVGTRTLLQHDPRFFNQTACPFLLGAIARVLGALIGRWDPSWTFATERSRVPAPFLITARSLRAAGLAEWGSGAGVRCEAEVGESPVAVGVTFPKRGSRAVGRLPCGGARCDSRCP